MFKKPSYFTSSLGGILTALFGLLANNNNNTPIYVILTVLIFFISMFYFVAGLDFINERNKFKGVSTFFFPSSKEDFVVLSRIIVWFVSAGFVIFLSNSFIK